MEKERKMKIAFCHHLSLSYYGGGEKWLIELAQELQKRGHDVEVYCLPFTLDKKRKFDVTSIEWKEGFRFKVDADVCYLTYNPLNWLNFKASCPKIGGIHTFAYWCRPNIKYGVLPLSAYIVNKFTSYFEFKRFRAMHTINHSFFPNHPNVYVIPNFVDTKRFVPQKKDDVFTIIYSNRKAWQKGWDTFQTIKEYFSWFGEIKISGAVPEAEMPAFLSSGHVNVNTSLVDTFGISIVESMLCETPVVTTPLNAHYHLKVPLMYANTPADYLKHIKALYDMDPTEYSQYASHCRESCLKYDTLLIVDDLERMFKEVVGEDMNHSKPFDKNLYYRGKLKMMDLK